MLNSIIAGKNFWMTIRYLFTSKMIYSNIVARIVDHHIDGLLWDQVNLDISTWELLQILSA